MIACRMRQPPTPIPTPGQALGRVGLQLLLGLVLVGAHEDRILQARALADERTDAEDAVLQRRIREDAAVPDDHVVDGALVEFGRRQIAVLGVDRGVRLEEIERRQRLRQGQVRLEKRVHGADVLPVALGNTWAKSFFLPSQAGDDPPCRKSVIVLSSASGEHRRG